MKKANRYLARFIVDLVIFRVQPKNSHSHLSITTGRALGSLILRKIDPIRFTVFTHDSYS